MPPFATTTTLISPATASPALSAQGLPALPLARVDPKQEVTSRGYDPVAGGVSVGGAYWQALNRWIDDLEWDQWAIYDKMLLDPKVHSSIETLKDGILADEFQVLPAITDESDPVFGQAKDLADFCSRSAEGLQSPLAGTLRQMLGALSHGNKLAEVVYRDGAGADKGKLVLDRIKVKSRTQYRYVVDPYLNVVAIAARLPQAAGIASSNPPTTYLSSSAVGVPGMEGYELLLPRERFAVLSWMPKDDDPRGSSQLRTAYTAWLAKFQAHKPYMGYLGQFAGPSLVGKTDPQAHDEQQRDASGAPLFDANGLPLVTTPNQRMSDGLSKFQNGSFIVVSAGADVIPIPPQGDGTAFLNAFEFFDQQIAYAILRQTRATTEAQHGSKADSQTGQDVLGLLIRWGKAAVAEMLRRDVFRPLVRYNFGDDAADRLTPYPSLGKVEFQDAPQYISAVAGLIATGKYPQSLLPELFEKMGLPADFDPKELDGQAQAAAALKTPPPQAAPNSGTPPAGLPPGRQAAA